MAERLLKRSRGCTGRTSRVALDWTRKGMDFADALHIARAGRCRAFLSFDKGLVKRAKGMTPIPVQAP